jgi:hypothetical protein
MPNRFALFLVAAAAGFAAAVPVAPAGSPYAWTNKPYWDVGKLDKELSLLCRRDQFNQVQKNRLKIWYTGKDNIGRGNTGVAKRGWNLSDPLGKAVADRTYHFVNDGYSDCKVFVAP